MAKPPVQGRTAGQSAANREDLIQLFMENQGEELKIKKQELEIRALEAKQNASFAEKTLDAQERDRIDGRRHETRMMRDRLIFAGLALVLVVVLSIVALVYDQAEIVKILVQMLSSLLVGAFGGYFYGKSRSDKSADSDS